MCVVLTVFLGCCSSLIAWWIINRILTPCFYVSDLAYDSNGDPYVRVKNNSRLNFNIYDIVGYIYYFDSGNNILRFIYTDKKRPVLTCKGTDQNEFIIRLAKRYPEAEKYICNGNKLRIVVTGQNRFGVKQIYTKEIKIEDGPKTVEVID